MVEVSWLKLVGPSWLVEVGACLRSVDWVDLFRGSVGPLVGWLTVDWLVGWLKLIGWLKFVALEAVGCFGRCFFSWREVGGLGVARLDRRGFLAS